VAGLGHSWGLGFAVAHVHSWHVGVTHGSHVHSWHVGVIHWCLSLAWAWSVVALDALVSRSDVDWCDTWAVMSVDAFVSLYWSNAWCIVTLDAFVSWNQLRGKGESNADKSKYGSELHYDCGVIGDFVLDFLRLLLQMIDLVGWIGVSSVN